MTNLEGLDTPGAPGLDAAPEPSVNCPAHHLGAAIFKAAADKEVADTLCWRRCREGRTPMNGREERWTQANSRYSGDWVGGG